jgi:hypothetical protein
VQQPRLAHRVGAISSLAYHQQAWLGGKYRGEASRTIAWSSAIRHRVAALPSAALPSAALPSAALPAAALVAVMPTR